MQHLWLVALMVKIITPHNVVHLYWLKKWQAFYGPCFTIKFSSVNVWTIVTEREIRFSSKLKCPSVFSTMSGLEQKWKMLTRFCQQLLSTVNYFNASCTTNCGLWRQLWRQFCDYRDHSFKENCLIKSLWIDSFKIVKYILANDEYCSKLKWGFCLCSLKFSAEILSLL